MVSKQRFVVLDGLRGIAAASVVLLHVGQMLRVGIFPNGYLAVDFFFMLSGFVLADAYAHRIGRSISFRGFVVRRVVRLYPMVVAGALIGLVALGFGLDFDLASTRPSTSAIIAAFSFGVTLLPFVPFPHWTWTRWPINPPFWSLFFELAINVVFAVFGFRARTLLLAAVAITSLVASTMMRFHNPTPSLAYDGLRTSFGFTIGVLLHRAYIGNVIARFRLPAFVSCTLLVAILWGPAEPGAVYPLLAGPALALIIAGSHASRGKTDSKFSLFETAGDLSYPIYAVHFPILWLLLAVIPSPERSYAGVLSFSLLTLAVVALVSYLLSRVYDVPVRRSLSDAKSIARLMT